MKEAHKSSEVRRNADMITAVEFADATTKLFKSESEMLRAKYDYLFRTKILEFYQGKSMAF